MSDDIDEIERIHTAVVRGGHVGDIDLVRAHVSHDEGRIRASALTALHRLGCLDTDTLRDSLHDVDPAVRRRAAELTAHRSDVDVFPLLGDDDPLVVEMAAWACGERGSHPDDIESGAHHGVDDRTLHQLIELATAHEDLLVRESAVAALGALGDERGLPAILHGCTDKPAIRRRAVLALAPFAGSDVDEALRRALEDRDWQVRQAAEDIMGPTATDGDPAPER